MLVSGLAIKVAGKAALSFAKATWPLLLAAAISSLATYSITASFKNVQIEKRDNELTRIKNELDQAQAERDQQIKQQKSDRAHITGVIRDVNERLQKRPYAQKTKLEERFKFVSNRLCFSAADRRVLADPEGPDRLGVPGDGSHRDTRGADRSVGATADRHRGGTSARAAAGWVDNAKIKFKACADFVDSLRGRSGRFK